MKSARHGLAAMLLAGSVLAGGCLYSKSRPLGIEASARLMKSANYEVMGEAEGMSSSFTLFGIFPVTPEPDPDRAVEEALRSLGGDNLIEAVFYSETRTYIVGVVRIVRVKGKVIRYLNK